MERHNGAALRATVAQFMVIEHEWLDEQDNGSPDSPIILSRPEDDEGALATFAGQLRQDSETAYDELDKILRSEELLPLFRDDHINGEDKHIIHIVPRDMEPVAPMAWWLPVGLFIATVASLLFTGATVAINVIGLEDPAQMEVLFNNFTGELWRGIPYALAILLILVPHEMGHYFMMRRYGVPASLPYFIPAFGLSPFGTFGAAIVLRGALRNRKQLFDVGAAGPLAGLVLAIPILFIGLATSPQMPVTGGFVEGNSAFYVLAKILTFGEFLPNGEIDVMLNQLAWAGWTGLFVTSLNLIPVGQLDGGHILYALLGRDAKRFFLPFMVALAGLTLVISSVWLVFMILLFFMGRVFAVPLDAITPLNPARYLLGIGVLIFFGMIFVPNPISTDSTNGLLGTALTVSTMFTVLWVCRRRIFA